MSDVAGEPCAPPGLDEFADRCFAAWSDLFERARGREEVQFAMALSPEFRGMRDAGWNTATSSWQAFDDYLVGLDEVSNPHTRLRFALSLYSHLSEASGFYEIPKNMMRIAGGLSYNMYPYQHLVRHHRLTGENIAPNANSIMADLLGNAEELQLTVLRDILLETFDADIRNGYAHADYIIWGSDIRFPRRNGGTPRVVSFADFTLKLNRALNFFDTLRDCIREFILSYREPRHVMGRLNNDERLRPSTIHFDEADGVLKISC